MLAILCAMYYNVLVISRCDGMVDVTDSKSVGGNIVWVRVPPPAPEKSTLRRAFFNEINPYCYERVVRSLLAPSQRVSEAQSR